MTKSTITREQVIALIAEHSYDSALVDALEHLLAAMDSEPVDLPRDYLQGHKDGLEWAAQLAESNHPQTGDWLYDDPIELAKAIRKGQDMPPAQPAQVVPEEATPDSIEILASGRCRDHVVYQWDEDQRNAAADSWNACRAAMLHAGNSPAQSDCCPAQNCIHSAQGVDRPVAWHHTAKSKEENHSTCCFSYAPSHDFGPRYEKPQSQPHYLPERLDYDRALHFLSTEPRKVTPETVIGGNSPVIPDGWTCNDKANAALMMLDRIETADPVDDDRIDGIKRIVCELAAAPHDTPALNSVQSVDSVADRWIPVSERMPDDDDFVYIWPRPDFGVELHVGQYCECSPKGDGWYAQVYEQNYGIEWHPITVTHWMPLPNPPKEEK